MVKTSKHLEFLLSYHAQQISGHKCRNFQHGLKMTTLIVFMQVTTEVVTTSARGLTAEEKAPTCLKQKGKEVYASFPFITDKLETTALWEKRQSQRSH
jgi:hypothetical protein